MDLKERFENVKAMYNAGLRRSEIAKELNLTYSQVDWTVKQLGLYKQTIHKNRGKPIEDIFLYADVLEFIKAHPPGSTVQDENGRKYVVVSVNKHTCEVFTKSKYRICLQWIELARVDWLIKRGKDPRMEEWDYE